MKARTILTGCGVGVVATMPYMWPLLSPYRFAFYHSFHPLSSIIWGALIDFVVVSALATVFFFYFEKRGNIYRSLIWVLVAAWLVTQIQKVHLSTSWPALRFWKSAGSPGSKLVGRVSSLEAAPPHLRSVGQRVCDFARVSGVKRTVDCA